MSGVQLLRLIQLTTFYAFAMAADRQNSGGRTARFPAYPVQNLYIESFIKQNMPENGPLGRGRFVAVVIKNSLFKAIKPTGVELTFVANHDKILRTMWTN